MPWASGNFSRTNGTYNGSNVWQQDEAAAVDIEANRHDTHDQDLSDGINACLAKDGSNSMTSDLNMDGNNIVSLGGMASLNLTGSTAVDLTNGSQVFNVGATTGQHLAMDGNEVQSKSDATTAAAMSINRLGGNLNLGAQSGTGTVILFKDAAQKVDVTDAGIDLRGSLSNDPGAGGSQDTLLELSSSSGARAADIGYNTSANLRVYNRVHEGEITLDTEDSAGTVQTGHIRVGGSSTATAVGFHNAAPQTKQTVSGSRGSNAALQSLLTALETIGLITDASS